MKKRIFQISLCVVMSFIAINSMADDIYQKLILTHCPKRAVFCFTNKNKRYVGYLFIPQFPRILLQKIYCFPYGETYHNLIAQQLVNQCNANFSLICNRLGGCIPAI